MFGKSIALFVVLIGIAACGPENRPIAVSLDQAREIAQTLQNAEIEVPPRSIADLKIPNRLKVEDLEDSACSKSLDYSDADMKAMAQLIADRQGTIPWRLRHKADRAFMTESLRAAIIYANAYDNNAGFDFVSGEAGAMLAIFKANRGDIQGAKKTFANSQSNLVSSFGRRSDRSCDLQTSYYLNRVQAHMAYFEEDYQEVEYRAEAAIITLKEVQALESGECTPGMRQGWRISELYNLRAKALVATGKLTEAEAALRQYVSYADRRRMLDALSSVLLEQGRTDDALITAYAAFHAVDRRGVYPCGSYTRAATRESLARAFMVLGRWQDASRQYDKMKTDLVLDPETWHGRYAATVDYGILQTRIGSASTALGIFDTLAARRAALFSANDQAAAEARALRGLALASMGRNEEALAVFQAELPAVIANWRDAASNDVRNAVPYWRLRLMTESYLNLLLEQGDIGAISDAFTTAEAVTGRGIQRAFQGSIARVLERENADQGLIRSLQDTEQAIESLRRQLVAKAAVNEKLEGDRARLRQAEAALRALNDEVERRYPAYKALVNPAPVSITSVQNILAPDEALVLTYVGEDSTFVWAVAKSGPPKSVVVPIGRHAMQAKVKHLRRALAPDFVQKIGDIPPYDVDAAHTLYKTLLAPVSDRFDNAKHLIVVADGALRSLPFGVLVTDEWRQTDDKTLLFDRYRSVPWLGNRFNLSRVPSASALVALRQHLQQRAEEGKPFAGFGDPVFGGDEATSGSSRGASVKLSQRDLTLRVAPGTRSAASADLSQLERLPETADEIIAIANAMGADLKADVFLRERASETLVKELSNTGRLADYKVLSFATHGLVPGDLDGLWRPALALSRPAGANQEDGLLTTDDIIGLKLNADWVVLSACNTGADNGKGGDAVSGLSRAFFHAGTRALLVSNWPVHSDATKQLMVKLFQGYSKGGGARAEAMHVAMTDLMRNGSFKDASGKQLFAYSHPLFWAAFTLMGDGAGAGLMN